MAHTNSWNEASPAGTDLASTADDHMRQIKLDTRERMAIDHIWNSSLDYDGMHKTVTLRPSDNTAIFTMSQSPSLTGANAQSFFDLTQTWNTTGTPTFFKVNVTDTASNAASLLMDLQVGGVSKFSVKKDGTITFTGAIATTSILTVTGFGSHTIVAAGTGINSLTLRNSSAGTGNYASFSLGNDTSATALRAMAFASDYATSGRYIADSVCVEGTLDGGLVLSVIDAAGAIRMYTFAGEVIRVTAGGKVGIGTAAPIGKLEVTGGCIAPGDAISAPVGVAINGYAGVSPHWGQIVFGDGSGHKFYIGTRSGGNFTSRMTILDTGNIGIGTDSPGYKLEVNGTTRFAGDATVQGVTFAYSGATLTVTLPNEATGNSPALIIGNATADWTASGALGIVNRAGTTYYLWVDQNGKLRIGTSRPTNLAGGNDLSGTIVGTQS